MTQSNAPNQGGYLHCQPRERGVKYSMWWGRGSRKHQQGMRKRTGKRGHRRVTYGAGPPEVGWRGEDAPRKEQRGLTHPESPLAVGGRWVAQLPALSSPALASLVSGERHLGRTGGLLLLVCLFFNHNFEVPFSVSLHCETGSAWAGAAVWETLLLLAPQTLRALWVYRFEASLHKFSRGWKPWENTHEGETNHLLAGTAAGGGLRNELFGLNSAVCAHVT